MRAAPTALCVWAVLLLNVSPALAQAENPLPTPRAIPMKLGVRAANGEVSQESALAWNHWAVAVDDCVNTPKTIECHLRFMNGDASPHRGCIHDARLGASTDDDGLPLRVVWQGGAEPTDASDAISSACGTLRANSASTVTLRLDPRGGGSSGALKFTLRDASIDSIGAEFVFEGMQVRPR